MSVLAKGKRYSGKWGKGGLRKDKRRDDSKKG